MTKFGKILAAICLIDLASTVIGMEMGLLRELNPVLIEYFKWGGIHALAMGRMLLIAVGILAVEMPLHYNLISRGECEFYYAAAISSYIAIYIGETFIFV